MIMRYADVIWNDIVAGDGLCVSFYTQGCPHRCPGCHNPQTWDFEGGKEFPASLLDEIVEKLNAQGIKRSLCVLGGEPLCAENLFLTTLLIRTVREKLPDTKIYIWTGYTYEELQNNPSTHMQYVLANVNTIIDGLYIQEQRDVSLKMRGSRNQRIIDIQ
jgi:anaerobic ribonucleoside-triphosphate reductase activating protein